MATYEFFLWEPDIDLSARQWEELQEDAYADYSTLIEAVKQNILFPYRDKDYPAPHITKFYQLLLAKVTDPNYVSYFEGYVNSVQRSHDYFMKAPTVVDNKDSATDWVNMDEPEMARVLLEAIAESGVCAYTISLRAYSLLTPPCVVVNFRLSLGTSLH